MVVHELLMALNGFTGGIFQKDDRGTIRVVADLPFIRETEVSLLNKICFLATHYSRLKQFIRDVEQRKFADGLRPGLYLQALARGLKEVLTPYVQRLIEVEKELLSDKHLTPTHVQARLEELFCLQLVASCCSPFYLVLPALSNVLNNIITTQAHGCQILDLIQKAAATGMPTVRSALLKLLQHGHCVMYRQVYIFLLNGMLLDQEGEFFIREMDHHTLNVSEKEADGDEDLALPGVTGRQLQQMMDLDEPTAGNTCLQKYSLRAEQLPFYIPSQLAQKILFIGETVYMLHRDKHGQPTVNKKGLFSQPESVFSKKLMNLSKADEFSLMAFESIIDELRSVAAKGLLELVVEEGGLMEQLHTLKDFYLLGRGELFIAFMDQASHLLTVPPKPFTEYDVNMVFVRAAHSVLLDDEKLLQRFKFTLPATANKASDDQSLPPEPGWNIITLTYSVEWPMHTVFTPAVFDRYNTILRFLLSIRRAQLRLQHVWAHHMRKVDPTQRHDNSKWLLRNHMAFLIDNLQYYLQVDVIESQFKVLMDKVQAGHDFEQICMAHEQFLSSLLAQCFLHMKPISHCLQEILSLSHKFCHLVEEEDTIMLSAQKERMEEISLDFQRQSGLLFRILSSVSGHQKSPHLAQFLLRLDFNRYFTEAGGQLGLAPAQT